MTVDRIILLLLVILASLLRWHEIGHESLWMDEIRQVKYYYDSKGFGDVVTNAATQNQPPLDYLVGYFMAKVFSFSELIARLPPFVYGVLLVCVSYLLATYVLGRPAGLITACLATFSPILIQYSQEAQPYSISFFLIALMLFLFFRAISIDRKQLRRWLLYGIVATFALHSRGMSPVTSIVALNLTYIAISVLAMNRQESIFSMRKVLWMISASAVAAALFLPSFLAVINESHFYLESAEKTDWEITEPLIVLFGSIFPRMFVSTLLPVAFGIVVGSYAIWANRRRNPLAIVLLAYVFIEPVVVIYMYYAFVHSGVLEPKTGYFAHTMVPIYAVAAYGYVFLIDLIFGSKQVALQRACMFSVAVAVGIFSAPGIASYYAREKTDYRSAAEYLTTIYREGDAAVYDSFYKYGEWEPRLYGKGLYFAKDLSIKQYKWEEWIEVVHSMHEYDRLLFLLHEGVRGVRSTDPAKFEEFNTKGLSIIFVKDDTLSVRKQTLILLDELIRIFPDDSSKVQLLLAKAAMICKCKPTDAQQLVSRARKYLPDTELGSPCENWVLQAETTVCDDSK